MELNLAVARLQGGVLRSATTSPQTSQRVLGSTSRLFSGNFADLLIGLYGTMEILVDPYTDFAKGTTGVRALQTIDIAVRHAESFAAMQDAIT